MDIIKPAGDNAKDPQAFSGLFGRALWFYNGKYRGKDNGMLSLLFKLNGLDLLLHLRYVIFLYTNGTSLKFSYYNH